MSFGDDGGKAGPITNLFNSFAGKFDQVLGPAFRKSSMINTDYKATEAGAPMPSTGGDRGNLKSLLGA